MSPLHGDVCERCGEPVAGRGHLLVSTEHLADDVFEAVLEAPAFCSIDCLSSHARDLAAALDAEARR